MTNTPKTSKQSNTHPPINTPDLVQDLHAMMEALIQRCGETKRLGIDLAPQNPSELLTLYELAIRLDLLIESYEES